MESIDQTNMYWSGRSRTCPRCGASFTSNFDRGQCTNCRHVFYASHPELGDTPWWERPQVFPPPPPRYATPEAFLNMLRMGLDAAAEARDKGWPRREGWNLITTVPLIMAHAVRAGTSHDAVAREFAAQGGVSAIERLAELVEDLFLKPERLPLCPLGAPPGIGDVVDATHIAWFLGRWDVAGVIAQLGKEDRLADTFQHTPMWRDYARGNAAAQEGRPYRPLRSSPKGAEKHAYVYMLLLGAVTSGVDVESAIHAADLSFVQRNRDRRLHNMPFADGDAHRPAKWHFRKDAILRLAAHKFGLVIDASEVE